MTEKTADKQNEIKSQHGAVQRTRCLCPCKIHRLKIEPQVVGVVGVGFWEGIRS